MLYMLYALQLVSSCSGQFRLCQDIDAVVYISSFSFCYVLVFCLRSSSIRFLVFDSWNDDDIKLFSERKHGVISIHLLKLQTQANPQIADMVLVFSDWFRCLTSTLQNYGKIGSIGHTLLIMGHLEASSSSAHRCTSPEEAMEVVM